jgi:hypothetical protein
MDLAYPLVWALRQPVPAARTGQGVERWVRRSRPNRYGGGC